MADIRINLLGRAEAVAAVSAITPKKSGALLQQAVNRTGRDAAAKLAREVRQSLPVKLKYIRSRIRFRNATGNGTPARIRILGAGRDASAYVRPRHANLKYPSEAQNPQQIGPFSVKETKQRRKRGAVAWGVGGAMPRQSGLRAFVAAVGAGRRFVGPWSKEFEGMRNATQVFQRAGRSRYPFTLVKGVTVGEVATRAGLVQPTEQAWAQAITTEHARRVESLARQAARR